MLVCHPDFTSETKDKNKVIRSLNDSTILYTLSRNDERWIFLVFFFIGYSLEIDRRTFKKHGLCNGHLVARGT